MTLPATISLLDDLCDEGLIDGYMNASPCSTWSRARFRPGGPRPLRHRGDWAWGLPGLTASEQARVDEANLLCVSSVLQERAVAEQDRGHPSRAARGPGR